MSDDGDWQNGSAPTVAQAHAPIIPPDFFLDLLAGRRATTHRRSSMGPHFDSRSHATLQRTGLEL
jgi:hypothetical protein